MRTRVTVGVIALVAVAIPGAAVATTAPGPPEHVLELARGAAAEARGVARGLVDEIAEQGTPRGQGSTAFAERHAVLAAKHAEHPGNAAAVHAALAEGASPSTAKGKGNGGTPPGQAKKSDAAALRGAREKFADGWPGRGLGRDEDGADEAAD